MHSFSASRGGVALKRHLKHGSCAQRAEQLRARILGVPQRPGAYAKCNAQQTVRFLVVQ